MEQFTMIFLNFIDAWGYLAVAVLMGLENACIPIPSELILGFAGYLIFAGKMHFTGALAAGMIGGMAGSFLAYAVGNHGGHAFVQRYGKYFFVKDSHVEFAQRWFDQYGIKAVFFSRMLPIVRTFISLPAGFAHVNIEKFFFYTFLGSLPWTVLMLWAGMMLGEGWQQLTVIGHELSLAFVGAAAVVMIILYVRYKRIRKDRQDGELS
ncbi:membrane protein DedA with SNARE-associated domain [Anaerospora hongkongensis]|uniref:Membrane protein DedA with SNARE-associated domain n=1 Tax=Anaerospora hongkongensis TaxID=244830 RepID=A0A4R1Q9U3_9FIRM|nr:DedA family protein [Anaerospora hongkongensis]TCL38697.1 membrane protein DedA with SNARE-associated domain [Anaerospora hongkongensis]